MPFYILAKAELVPQLQIFRSLYFSITFLSLRPLLFHPPDHVTPANFNILSCSVSSSAFSMGTLMGHVVPGSIFLLAGLWWAVNIWSSYFAALKSRRRFRSSASFPLWRGSRVPWESIIIIICATAAIVGESASPDGASS